MGLPATGQSVALCAVLLSVEMGHFVGALA
jgi:hypothetical protein